MAVSSAKDQSDEILFRLENVDDLELKYQLQSLDKNGDGVLSLEEVVRGARNLRIAQANMKLLKQLLGSMFVMVLLIIGIVGGLTAYIVAENQISKYDSTNNQLLNKANDQPATVATSMTRIPLGALHLFPDSLPLLKDVSYRDPYTDALVTKIVDRVELSKDDVLTIMTVDGVKVVVAGVTASFSYSQSGKIFTPVATSSTANGSLHFITEVANLSLSENLTTVHATTTTYFNHNIEFRVCSACCSCASHSFPTTPDVLEVLEDYYNSLPKAACASLSRAAIFSNHRRDAHGEISRRNLHQEKSPEAHPTAATTIHDNRRRSAATVVDQREFCTPSTTSIYKPASSTDEIFPAYFPPLECQAGCANWTDLARDANPTFQPFANSKWKDAKLLAQAGSSCARPFNDAGDKPWCYCKNRGAVNRAYCLQLATLDRLYPDYEPPLSNCISWDQVDKLLGVNVTDFWFWMNLTDAKNYCAQPYLQTDSAPWCYTLDYGRMYCKPRDKIFPDWQTPSKCELGCARWDQVNLPGTSLFALQSQKHNASSFCAQPFHQPRNQPWCYCAGSNTVKWAYCTLPTI